MSKPKTEIVTDHFHRSEPIKTVPATVKDVAAAAGVSPATVSRVLNKSDVIKPKTRNIVENAIRDLSYQRTNTRRGRQAGVKENVRKDVGSLVLLIPDTHVEAMLTPLTGNLLHGAEAVARKHGYQFVLSRLSETDGLAASLSPKHIDGIIVRGGAQDVTSVLPTVPIVWAFVPNIRPAFGDMVYPDNETIGQMAARYLIDRGHKHILGLNPVPDHPEAQERLESFYANVTNAPGQTVSLPDRNLSLNDIDQVLKRKPRVTGLFLPLGDAHLGTVLAAMKSHGLHVNKDIEIISCNNDVTHLKMLDPRLPNIDIQSDEIGRVATETLLWRMDHALEHRRFILIAPRLVPGAQ